MRKGLFAAGLIPVFTLLGAGAAQAATTSQTVVVSPGSRVCTPAVFGTYKVRGEGQASPGVRFTLHQSYDGVNFQQIDQSASDYTTAWASERYASWNPGLFPGYFKVCARNANTRGSTVTLRVTTDA